MKSCLACNSYISDDAKYCPNCGFPVKDGTDIDPDVLPPGTELKGGLCRIGKCIGRGGFGITYKGCYLKDNKIQVCAIKELFINGSRRIGKTVSKPYDLDTQSYFSFKKRFFDEAKILLSLCQGENNPEAIPDIYDVFEENGTVYYVMEFVDGKTIDKIVEEKGCFDENTAVDYILQICSALKEVHKLNIIHRDIKPQNIIINETTKKAYLVDFGSAREFYRDITQKYTVLISEGYSAPEQYSSHGRFGVESDIYSLGATLYFMLTGVIPLSAMDRLQGEQLTPPKKLNPKLLDKTESVILKCMSIERKRRYTSVDELENELKSIKKILTSIYDKEWFYDNLFTIKEVEKLVSCGLTPQQARQWVKVFGDKSEAINLASKWAEYIKDPKTVKYWRKKISEYVEIDESIEKTGRLQILVKKLIEENVYPIRGWKIVYPICPFVESDYYFYNGFADFLMIVL